MSKLLFPDAFMRNFIGLNQFDSLSDRISRIEPSNFPPFNIEQTGDNSYSLTFALAGFTPDDVDVSVEGDTLVVQSVTRNPDSGINPSGNFIHRGISFRHFNRKFVLGEHIEVKSASMEHGMLKIYLERNVPEAVKPKSIPINKIDHIVDFTAERKAVA